MFSICKKYGNLTFSTTLVKFQKKNVLCTAIDGSSQEYVIIPNS